MPTPSAPPPARPSFLLGGLALAAALAGGGLRVRAGSVGPSGPPEQIPPAQAVAREAPREIRGVVLDPANRPVPGATVVAGASEGGAPGNQVVATDAAGHFACRWPAGVRAVDLVASKPGLAVAEAMAYDHPQLDPHDLKIRLGEPAPFVATLLDPEGRPLVGAVVRVEMIATSIEHKHDNGSTISTSYVRIRRQVVAGSPIESLAVATTDATGLVRFEAFREGAGLKLAVTAADGRTYRVKPDAVVLEGARRSMHDQGYITAPAEEATQVVAVPSARIDGRVVATVPGVDLAGLTANYQESRRPGEHRPGGNSGASGAVDRDGRFAFDFLAEGTVNVFVHGPGENRDWTYEAAKDVDLVPGQAAEVTLELVRGVEVEGTVVARGTGAPVGGATLGVHGPFRPRTGAMTTGAGTDARGRYRYLLPAGETYFYVMGLPPGFARLDGDGSSQAVVIPAGAARFAVPPIAVVPAVTVHGRVLDAANNPVGGATVSPRPDGGFPFPTDRPEVVTDARGEFRLPPGRHGTIAVGRPARLLVRLPDGSEQGADPLPDADGAVRIRLAAPAAAPPATP